MTTLVVFVSCSKLAEFLHVAFISVEKHYPVFFPLVCSSFSRYYVCKNLYLFNFLLSRQHVTAKTVFPLKIPQNVDLLQRATLKKMLI